MLPYHSHTILPTQRTVIQRYSGRVGLTNVLQAMQELWADPDYDRSFSGISDLTGCTPTASVSDVRSLTTFLNEHEQRSVGRWVLIATDPMITALGILYARSSLKQSIQVCSTWGAACDYLQIELPET